MSNAENQAAAKPSGLSALLGRMRLLEIDHEPDGWPAVQMRDVSALCEALDASEVKLEAMRDAVERVNFCRVTSMELNELRMENDRLRGACKSAIDWLEGWASAEPYLNILKDAVMMPNAQVKRRRAQAREALRPAGEQGRPLEPLVGRQHAPGDDNVR